MRAWRIGLSWLCLSYLVLSGCKSSKPNLEPAKEPQRISLPPESDPRYSQPQKLPKEVTDMDPFRKVTGGGPGMPAMGGRRSGMGGSGSY